MTSWCTIANWVSINKHQPLEPMVPYRTRFVCTHQTETETETEADHDQGIAEASTVAKVYY